MAQECASVILQMVAQRLPHSLACTQLHIADSHAPTVCSSHRSFATRILQRLWPAHNPAGDTLAHKSASSGRDSLLLGMRTSGISLARHAPGRGAPIPESQSLQETLRQISCAYRRNDLALESPLSGVVPQALSRYFGSDTKAAYVIKPKNYDSRRDYPVLFFPRGDMDNCKLYTGMLRDIEDAIIVCVGTDTTSDTIGRADFQQIKSRFIPLLRDLGLNPDISRISLFSTADCESIWQYLDEGSSSQQ